MMVNLFFKDTNFNHAVINLDLGDDIFFGGDDISPKKMSSPPKKMSSRQKALKIRTRNFAFVMLPKSIAQGKLYTTSVISDGFY